jgi:hypothetical protein
VVEPKDFIAIVALIVSLGSVIVSVVALVRISRHNNAIRQYASAAPDIALLGQINQARQTMVNISVRIAEISKGKTDDKLTANENRQILDMGLAYSQAVETLHTSLDLACRLYRDGAIDRDRFRRQYEREIRELFEDGTVEDKKRLDGISMPYQALRAVYQEWFQKEN